MKWCVIARMLLARVPGAIPRIRALTGSLINTPLQWGARSAARSPNRFNGLLEAGQTVETVAARPTPLCTPLKWGVNESTSGKIIWGCAVVVLTAVVSAVGEGPKVTCDLSLIQPEQKAWVSGYWGYNAPKLVFDGTNYYSANLIGTEEATSTGVVYKLEAGKWTKGYECPINYQPPMLLLDSQKRLILIHSVMNARPVVLRARARGDCQTFEPLDVSKEINMAGYIGAAIHDDLLILGYLGKRGYDFCVITCDLKTGRWSPQVMLAPQQRDKVPYTTWLYPCIWPDQDGFHLLVANHSGYKNLYDRVHYMFLPYDLKVRELKPELVQSIDTFEDRMAFSMALWKDASDGSMMATALYSPTNRAQLFQVFRREARNAKWSKSEPGKGYVASLYQSPHDANTVWIPVTDGSGVVLYHSTDKCRSWQAAQLPDFAAAGVTGAAGFLYGISPTSGSVIEEGPAAVFSTHGPGGYAHWFVKFHTSPD
jgi:hypothetical protein